jgi:Pro-kumamolisin, activation domain.
MLGSFTPSEAQDAVLDWLRSHHPQLASAAALSPDGLSVRVKEASVSHVASLLDVSFHRLTYKGRIATRATDWATVPASVAPYIQRVEGIHSLSSLHRGGVPNDFSLEGADAKPPRTGYVVLATEAPSRDLGVAAIRKWRVEHVERIEGDETVTFTIALHHRNLDKLHGMSI